jgi:hypothetical protein
LCCAALIGLLYIVGLSQAIISLKLARSSGVLAGFGVLLLLGLRRCAIDLVSALFFMMIPQVCWLQRCGYR